MGFLFNDIQIMYPACPILGMTLQIKHEYKIDIRIRAHFHLFYTTNRYLTTTYLTLTE